MDNHDAGSAVTADDADSAVTADAAVAETVPDGSRVPRPGRRALAIALDATDYVLAIVSGVMVVLVHDLAYLLNEPYWLDEAWVADSVRVPLGLVPRLSSSTPLGWTLLLRLVPAGGLERQRLVPLIFAGLAVSAAYLLGRELRLTRFTAGLLTATAALLSPAMLVREDLKQYTAEAFCSILLWLLVARAENKWTRWRLAAIAVTAAIGPLFAETAIITGAAALCCLGLAAIIRRQWRRLVEVAVATAGTLAGYGVVFEVVVKPRMNSALSSYWSPLYAPATVTGAASFFWAKFQALGPYIAFPAVTAAKVGTATVGMTATGLTTGAGLNLVLVAAAIGVVALAVVRRFALAAMLPVTLIAVIGASADRIYPFGDGRTSTFWIVLVPVLGAIGVAIVSHGIGRLPDLIPRLAGGRLGAGSDQERPDRQANPWTKLTIPVVSVACAILVINYYKGAVGPDINIHDIAHDDTRSEVQFAEAHQRPGDVFVVDYGASYSFSYYYKAPATAYPDFNADAAGFIPQYPGDPHVIVVTNGQTSMDIAGMRKAIAIVTAEPPGDRGRVWVIREHAVYQEAVMWHRFFATLNAAGGHVTIYNVFKLGYKPGFQPLAMYALSPRGASPPSTPHTLHHVSP